MIKHIVMILLTVWGLGASAFEDEKESKKEIHKNFRENVSDMNAILKRGEYNKVAKYESDVSSIIRQIELLDIPEKNKEELQNDINSYVTLVNNIRTKLQEKAPKLHDHHLTIINGLNNFNKKISSIGLSELSENWQELSTIKNRFVKKPSQQLEKEFDEKWSVVVITITEQRHINTTVRKKIFRKGV
ncbi:MAG: hypothetical protein KU29_08470 [Sulfurovum sp. FS06-10]|nr:MAG: hypothetical protein KU29_08470 [Sulfurovum sp. FS06-10]